MPFVRHAQYRSWRRLHRHLNLDLICLSSLVVVANLPYLSHLFVPIHDTAQGFMVFHYFYSHLFFTHELPKWTLYYFFGVAAGAGQMCHLTPPLYVCMWLGTWFGIEDALLLFKLGICLEQLIFLFGTYLLARHLYRSRLAVWLVCIGSLSSVVWYSQIWFNFRLYYMVPLGLYFLFRFFDRKAPQYLWYAATVFFFGLLGNLPYYGVLWLFIVLITVIGMSFEPRTGWRWILSLERATLAYGLVLILLLGSYLLLLRSGLSGMEIVVPDRDPATGENSLQTFLTYGGELHLQTLLQMLVYGWPVHTFWSGAQDNTAYVDLLPLFLAGYAVIRVRAVQFLVCAAIGILLMWLAAGGCFTMALYYVPVVSVYRHVALVFGLLRVFVLLCAGFGLEALLRSGRAREVIWAGLTVVIAADMISTGADGHALQWWGLDSPWSKAFCLRLAAYCTLPLLTYGVVVQRQESVNRSRICRPLLFSLVLAYSLDMSSFQVLVADSAPFWPREYAPLLTAANVNRPMFQLQRSDRPPSSRAEQALTLISALPQTVLVTSAYSFVQMDPWRSRLRRFAEPAGALKEVRNLLEQSPGNEHAARLLGVEFPKLRLVSEALFVENWEGILQRLARGDDIDSLVVLRAARDETGREGGPPPPGFRDAVAAQRATANELIVDAEVVGAPVAWLVFADRFSTDWRVFVNGTEERIWESYPGFKAVRLNEGKNVVHFTINKSLYAWTVDFMALMATLFFVWVAFLFLKEAVTPHRDRPSPLDRVPDSSVGSASGGS
jgi:hypothetical protein